MRDNRRSAGTGGNKGKGKGGTASQAQKVNGGAWSSKKVIVDAGGETELVKVRDRVDARGLSSSAIRAA